MLVTARRPRVTYLTVRAHHLARDDDAVEFRRHWRPGGAWCPRGWLPRPYEQLAAVYRNLGSDSDARTVQHARHQKHRAMLPRYARAWGYLQDITVGYGYRPSRAALWLAILLATGTTIFALHPPPALSHTPAPAFNPLIYTLSLLLPVIDISQVHDYNPHGPEQWIAYALTAAGWILATAVAAGIIRALRRD